MRDIRCDGEFKRPGLGGICGQLLFRASTLLPLNAEVKCPRCKQIRHYETSEPPMRVNMIKEQHGCY